MTHRALVGFRYGSPVYKVGDQVVVNKSDLPLLIAKGYIEAVTPKKKKTNTKKAEG